MKLKVQPLCLPWLRNEVLLRKWVPQSLDGVYDSVVQINFKIKC